VKVEATVVEGRKVYSVRAFNQGIATYLQRLPTLWVEGEITELRRQARWASVFFTLKDPESGACLAVQMPRGQFDGLRLELVDGERVHVFGRPELYAERGDFHLRALTIERYGLGAHLAALERLKRKLAADGLFDASRKRPLPRIPALIGLVTGNDAAAKRDVLTAITNRFPPAHVLVAETYVQGPRAAPAIATAIGDLCARGADVIVLARGGGSFEDLLPFSDERLVRAVASCPVPVVSAVGHEQDTPLVDLAADVRASTPSVAGRLVVPDLAELRQWLERTHGGLERGARRVCERQALRLAAARDGLNRAPQLALERRRARLENVHGRLRALSPRATLERGYAIVRAGDSLLREPPPTDTALEVEVAGGSFGARSE
jgi:exodeoxyribonuclease VII large subunit